MDVKPTLQVIDAAKIKSRPGVTKGQTLKPIVGHDERPTDRVRTALATYEPGTIEELHWHPIEAYYFVISGRAIVRDLHGNEYEAGPGTSIYAPPGIAGAHEWQVKEALELIDIRACNETNRKMQFTVDKATKRSYIDIEEVEKREAISFKSHY